MCVSAYVCECICVCMSAYVCECVISMYNIPFRILIQLTDTGGVSTSSTEA